MREISFNVVLRVIVLGASVSGCVGSTRGGVSGCVGSTAGGVLGCVGSTAGGVGFVGAPGVFGAAAVDFLTVTVKVLLNFFFFLFLAFVVTLILAVPAFLAVTVILLPLAFTLATEALLDLAVNFFEALPDTFTVTLKALLIDFFLRE